MSAELIAAINTLKASLLEYTAKERTRLTEEVLFLELIDTSASTLIEETVSETTELVTTDINRLLGI